MRLFVAIRLDRDTARHIRRAQDAFRRHGVTGNYTPEENLHITLAFIGDYPDPDAVMDALEEVSFSPFRITADGVGCFGDLWWAGFRESPELEALAAKVRHALAGAGIPFDRKSFKAHVTFLRKAELPGRRPFPAVDAEAAAMTVDGISLMRSDRGKICMIYTEIGYTAADKS